MLMFVAATAVAQPKAQIVASYTATGRNWETDSATSGKMTLLANIDEAKWFNDISLWTDSLKSTPEGKKQWSQILMAACMTQTPDGGISIDTRKGPMKKVYTYVFTNLADSTLRHYDRYGTDEVYYDEPLTEMEWQISDSTATILGYECVLASTDYHGRRWQAWFTPEVPVPFGPWKLRGLPGLILKATADNGYSFLATGIENSDRTITPMYSADTYSKTERRKALADHEYFLNNREAAIQTEFGGLVTISSDFSNHPTYDAATYALEPDYKLEK